LKKKKDSGVLKVVGLFTCASSQFGEAAEAATALPQAWRNCACAGSASTQWCKTFYFLLIKHFVLSYLHSTPVLLSARGPIRAFGSAIECLSAVQDGLAFCG
jgi:hypothetical protein